MVLIESLHFSKHVYDYLTEGDYLSLQWELTLYPDIGDIIPGLNGARKIRCSKEGSGKRGGVRVIYYFRAQQNHIHMLAIYNKREKTDLTENDKKAIRRMIQEIHYERLRH